MPRHMSEEEFRLHLIEAIEYLIAAAKRYSTNGSFGASCTLPNGVMWHVFAQRVPTVVVMPPVPVTFSLS